MHRVGIGYDIHPFCKEPGSRKLILGGVEIAHPLALEGHSDADVLCHAIADAILGAIGEADIGHHFPNTDATLRGISSLRILARSAELVRAKGGRILNVDSTVLAEAPKIAPHLHTMREHLGKALGIPPQRVGIKATTNERLGAIGRQEGIAAMAVAGVELPEDV